MLLLLLFISLIACSADKQESKRVSRFKVINSRVAILNPCTIIGLEIDFNFFFIGLFSLHQGSSRRDVGKNSVNVFERLSTHN